MNIDAIVERFTEVAEQNKCEIVSIYLSGSYANHYFLEGVSDLDILLLVSDASDDLIERLLNAAGEQDVELDLCVLDKSQIYRNPKSIQVRESVMSSKLCGQLVYGDDLLCNWALPSVRE